jgi:hypothetical protein
MIVPSQRDAAIAQVLADHQRKEETLATTMRTAGGRTR